MKVLIACEFSGIVREAFKARGHDAWSCDLLPTEIPGQHIQGDVFELGLLNECWDLMIAHPPCTYLCRQANRWNVSRAFDREKAFQDALQNWGYFQSANAKSKCLENPIPHLRARLNMGDYTQIIHPYQFGHDYSKATCLWLENLKPLAPTNIVEITYYTTPKGKRYTKGWYFTPRNSKDRSRTFQGIADCMAATWG